MSNLSLAAPSHEEPGVPIVAVVLLLGSFVSYAVCFALAASTKRLSVFDYVAGTLGLFCGFGWIYFLYRANDVTLKHSFDLVEKGEDPAVARAINTRFRIAAGVAIAFGVAVMLVR
jgi:hypothetical protein